MGYAWVENHSTTGTYVPPVGRDSFVRARPQARIHCVVVEVLLSATSGIPNSKTTRTDPSNLRYLYVEYMYDTLHHDGEVVTP